MNRNNRPAPIRFSRGDLADRAQARRDARHLAQILRMETLLASINCND